MCPSKAITDPLGVSSENPDYGEEFIYVEFDPAASGVINNGNIVEVSAALASTTSQMLCKLTSATGNFEFLGVAVGAPAGGYTPGQVVKIQTGGVAKVLFDDAGNTTFGHLALQSATVAGEALDSATATLGKTLGIVLETVTVAAAGTPVLVYIRIM